MYPSLARRLCLLFSLYLTQYVGASFFMEALAVILRKNGMPLEKISLVYLFGIFWIFKFLWSPLIDKVKLFKTHFKGWLVISQTVLVLLPLIISRFSITEDFRTVAVLFTMLSFVSATQDVAVDGLAYRLLPPAERGIGNGIKVAGNTIGYMLGGGVTLIVYGYIGWKWCFIMIAAITSVALVQMLFFKEPQFTHSNIRHVEYIKRFTGFWKGNGKRRWLVLMFAYPAGISFIYALTTPILVDLGWSVEKIGFSVHIAGAGVSALSASLAGWLISRCGKAKVLVATALIQALCIPFMLIPAMRVTDGFAAFLCIGAILAVYTPAATVMSVYMMDNASDKMPATDYAMQHSLYLAVGLAYTIIGTASAGFFGYKTVIIAGSLLAVLSASFALRFVRQNTSCTDTETPPAEPTMNT